MATAETEIQHYNISMSDHISSHETGEISTRFGSRILRRLRHELMLEVGFVVLCLALAIGLEGKIVLAVVLACLKFAIPDWITAYLVLRFDSSRAHGIGVALLFVAAGLVRASIFAFDVLLIGVILFVPVFAQLGWRNPAAVGLGTGFVCAFGFLATVFPLALAATVVSFFSNTKLSFASGLTQLRRRVDGNGKEIKLDVASSLNRMAVASGISMAVCTISLLFLKPLGDQNNAVALVMLASFIMPFVWMPIFVLTARPAGCQ